MPGSTPKRPQAEGLDRSSAHVRLDPPPSRRARARWIPALRSLLAVGFLSCAIGTNAAEPKLLPPDQAFRFSARALDTRTLEANFTIAPGYYLYRDRMTFTVEPDGGLDTTVLPPGKVKEDPFFGRVETYRDRVAVRLPMGQATPGRTLTLVADSQGCADAGVCYPPHTQRVTLSVPRVDGKPGALVEAASGAKRWFP